jgi:uncharacterized protein YxjI
MKTYYVKQSVFSIKDRYKVYNDQEEICYHCEGKLLTITSEKKLIDSLQSQPLYTLKRKLMSLIPTFIIMDQDGQVIATLRRMISLLRPRFDIQGIFGNFQVNGDFLAHDFSIEGGAGTLVSVHKKWVAWGDVYEIAIEDESHAAFWIAIVILIDDYLYNEKQQSSRGR